LWSASSIARIERYFHLRVGQLGTEDDRQRLTASHRSAELKRHLTHNATDERVHFCVTVSVGHDGPRDRQTRSGRLALDVGELDPGALDRFRRQRHLDRLFSFGLIGRSSLSPHARHPGH